MRDVCVNSDELRPAIRPALAKLQIEIREMLSMLFDYPLFSLNRIRIILNYYYSILEKMYIYLCIKLIYTNLEIYILYIFFSFFHFLPLYIYIIKKNVILYIFFFVYNNFIYRYIYMITFGYHILCKDYSFN